MCEILTIKGNRDNIKFNKSDIEKAREYNSDGAGFVIFEKDYKKDKWFRYDLEYFKGSEDSWKSKYYNFYNKNTDNNKKDFTVKRMFLKQKELKENQLMICHFRLATSGHSKKNTQPIIKDNYLVIHNGIFGFKSLPKKLSDTAYFTEILEKARKELKIKTVKQEKKMIDKVLKYAKGSYSLFIHSDFTGKLYYIKNNCTSFCQSYDNILGSTKESRLPLIYRNVIDNKLINIK